MKHPELSAHRASGRKYTCLAIIVVPLVCGGDRGAVAAGAATDAVPTETVQEIEVTGERAGPRLWRVAKGDHVLWLLGRWTRCPAR